MKPLKYDPKWLEELVLEPGDRGTKWVAPPLEPTDPNWEINAKKERPDVSFHHTDKTKKGDIFDEAMRLKFDEIDDPPVLESKLWLERYIAITCRQILNPGI